MSVNINVDNVNFSCVPMIKEGFNGQHENIAWMCNNKTVENFWANPKYMTAKTDVCNITLPSVAGSTVSKSIRASGPVCTIRGPNWGTLTKAQCNSVGAQWDGSYCVYLPVFGCDVGWFSIPTNPNFCGKN